MYYPRLNNVSAARTVTSIFGGYNHNAVIGDGEFFEMENMTSDLYPVLSPRSRRGKLVLPDGTRAQDLCAAECMAYVDGSALVLLDGTEGGDRIELGLGEGEHRIAALGAYLIVFPEGKYVNTLDPEERGTVQEANEARGTISCSVCYPNGTYADIREWYAKIVTADEMANPETMLAEIDTSKYDHAVFFEEGTDRTTMYYWTDTNASWRETSTERYQSKVTVSISDGNRQKDGAQEWFALCREGMEISIVNSDHFAGVYRVESVEEHENTLQDSYTCTITMEKVNKLLYFENDVDQSCTVRLPVIKLDHVVGCGNRLWGCRYGESAAGDIVNELYATKLGDFKRWRTYVEDGAADDSWAASIGTPGAFTGAAVYGGRVYFFKRDRVFAMYGSDTTSFGYTEIVERGVQEGCADSLCVLDGYLYYKSPDGVVRFDGNSTQLLSDPLGYVKYTDAVAGGWRGKYYLSMKDADGGAHLFVLDTRRGLWHREDAISAESFLNRDDVLYIATDDGEVLTVGDTEPVERTVPWMVQTGIIGLNDPDKKYISKLSVRLKMELGARVRISIQYDSVGNWETVFSVESDELRTVTVPVILHRCDHLRMRIEGVGEVRIYSITKTIEQGGYD